MIRLICIFFPPPHYSNYMLLPATGDMAGDNETVRSLFLAALMVTSVMTGILFFDIEKEGVNAPPLISLMLLILSLLAKLA